MKNIELYSFPPSQNAVRTEIALNEKGLDFKKISLDLFKGEHREGPLSQKTPRMQVPTLTCTIDDQPITVYESIATIRFIDDFAPEPALLPPVSNPQARATALIRMEEFQAKLDPKNIWGSVVFRGKSKEELSDRIEPLKKELLLWESYLGNNAYLAGEQFTLADIAVFPLLIHFESLGYEYQKNTPSLKAYIDRCKQRPSVQKTGWLDNFYEVVKSRNPQQVLADS